MEDLRGVTKDTCIDFSIGPFAEINPSAPSFPTPTFHPPDSPSWPSFSRHANAPFLFQEPLPQTPHSPAWAPPPPNGSPTKISFPEPEIPEVDMAESSPGGPSPEKDKEAEGERPMAVGALRRVYTKRNERARSKVGRRRARVDDEESSEDESGDDEGYVHVQKTTNHYTLNMAGPGQQSDLPYRLLGCVSPFLMSVSQGFDCFASPQIRAVWLQHIAGSHCAVHLSPVPVHAATRRGTSRIRILHGYSPGDCAMLPCLQDQLMRRREGASDGCAMRCLGDVHEP